MKAWLLNHISNLDSSDSPLLLSEIPIKEPQAGEISIKISCCGVCHTELDEIEGRLIAPSYPIIPGHQVIGRVEKSGAGASRFKTGDRVGIAWIGGACGKCEQCTRGFENLCNQFKATGRDIHGGYAECMTIDEKFAFVIPSLFSDEEAAPLLCAGAIGYRSLLLTRLRDGYPLGLMGFGSSAHLVLKLAKHLYPNSKISVFARSEEERQFAKSLGAVWTGNINDRPPEKLCAIIDTTPSWQAILSSLSHLAAGGRLVINAIRKESHDLNSLLAINYQEHLWMEKEIKSVANITRHDVSEFLQLAPEIPLIPEVQIYPFAEANQALLDLKHKHVKGAKVLAFRQIQS